MKYINEIIFLPIAEAYLHIQGEANTYMDTNIFIYTVYIHIHIYRHIYEDKSFIVIHRQTDSFYHNSLDTRDVSSWDGNPTDVSYLWATVILNVREGIFRYIYAVWEISSLEELCIYAYVAASNSSLESWTHQAKAYIFSSYGGAVV